MDAREQGGGSYLYRKRRMRRLIVVHSAKK